MAAHGPSLNTCPRCGEATKRGYTEIRTAFMDLWGMYRASATYVADAVEYGQAELVPKSGRRVAYHCYRCELTLLTTTPWTPA